LQAKQLIGTNTDCGVTSRSIAKTTDGMDCVYGWYTSPHAKAYGNTHQWNRYRKNGQQVFGEFSMGHFGNSDNAIVAGAKPGTGAGYFEVEGVGSLTESEMGRGWCSDTHATITPQAPRTFIPSQDPTKLPSNHFSVAKLGGDAHLNTLQQAYLDAYRKLRGLQ